MGMTDFIDFCRPLFADPEMPIKLFIEADTIIPAIALEPNPSLFKILEGKSAESYITGDCREPGLISDSITRGWETARKINNGIRLVLAAFFVHSLFVNIEKEGS